jgi:hypothetical protein
MVEQSSVQDVAKEDSAEKRERGCWGPEIDLVNVPVHTHVLPNGKVLYWGRRIDLNSTKPESLHVHECKPLIWDPSEPGKKPIETPQPTRLKPGSTTEVEKVNVFCGGHAFLPDGKLLVAGGHDGADGAGLNQACIYDYEYNTWTALPPMNNGRWYPTVTTLADGTLLVSSGSYSDDLGSTVNVVPQIWDPKQQGTQKKWRTLELDHVFPLFPCMHVAPDGRVFMSGQNPGTWLLDTSKKGDDAWSECGRRESGFRDYTPSVMYNEGKVIYIGGGLNKEDGKPTDVAEIIDLKKPEWQKTGRMHYRRRQHNATILADGTVLVTGGTQGGGKGWQDGFNDIREGKPVHVAELWNPDTGQWMKLAAEKCDRCYHSTAVLITDATVLSAGGGEYEDSTRYVDYPKDIHKSINQGNYANGQVFYPPYLFRGPRPEIAEPSEPSKQIQVQYGNKFCLAVSEEPKIIKVTWIRLSSVTHTNNQNQRINILNFTHEGKKLTVTAPKQPEICPPGHYMLFAISEDGVPSKAKIIQIVSDVAVMSTRMSRAPAEGDYDIGSAARTDSKALDEAVRARSTGRRVTVGLTPQCIYGLGACWAGAYAALTALSGVAEVRPRANAQDSTAEVYLDNQGLPDLDGWPEQFAQITNGSYGFRGVEVTLTGTVQQHNGTLHVTGPSFDHSVTLKPLVPGVKVQWDSEAGQARPVTDDELASYQEVEARSRDLTSEAEPMCVTGPLTKTDTEWTLYVRVVEPFAATQRPGESCWVLAAEAAQTAVVETGQLV